MTTAPLERQPLYGKYAVATILLLGVAATVFSQFYNARLQRGAVQLWGARAAKLIVNGPLANALLLAPVDAKHPVVPVERLMVGGEHFNVIKEQDVAGRPDISRVRQSLVNDASFDWSSKDADCRPQWNYALEFSDGDATALLLIAPNCASVRLAETGATASLRPIMKGLAAFMREQFPEQK